VKPSQGTAKKVITAVAIGGGVAAVVVARRRLAGRPAGLPDLSGLHGVSGWSGPRNLRWRRGLAAVQLAVRGGARYATSAPRLFAAAGQQREDLRNDLALQTAEDVATTLGAMKGVLMKLGQMASYVDDGLSPAVRRTLSRLQDSVPPMSQELAAGVVEEELGLPPERAFAEWDPVPIAAASIGQVHRAITHDGRAVAVKVQYPGIAETMTADLDNVALLRRMLRMIAPNQDVEALVAELKDRIIEELDYEAEASNQRRMAAYYDGHPTIHVPKIIDELSTRRLVTSELSDGARFSELLTWSQEERDLAAETIYRFVFRSLYEVHAFNGDPHPGNYLFHGGGKVTFLDFGLVKKFTQVELAPLVSMVRDLCVDNDPEAFRTSMEEAGFLIPGAPLSTETIVDHMAVFYDTVRYPGRLTMTEEYASAVVRRFFDVRSPMAPYVNIPRSYVILQRINLGLFAVLGQLHATADWRAIAEEIWPFVLGPPSTPMGHAEAGWLAARPTIAHSPA
jgi:predicted unusual protein kinase regulating ubiquinone biosynthesis (AarF/ABC1/UbiB family)